MSHLADPAASDPAAAVLSRLKENLASVEAGIAAACARSGRPRTGVQLLAVVKYAGARETRLLVQAGVKDLAEGTVQGAAAKQAALAAPALAAPGVAAPSVAASTAGGGAISWHLVGHLQRNKVKKALVSFQSIHSLDSARLAAKIEEELIRLEELPGPGRDGPVGGGHPGGAAAPRFYVEINTARDPAKGGLSPEEAGPFLRDLRSCPRVLARVAGLMAMAPHSDDPEASRVHFRSLRELQERLSAGGLLPAAGLSMGMSADFTVAVEEGATVVRVGSRLFEGVPGVDVPSAPPANAEARPCR